jgi:hypothetical protein
VDKNDTLAEIFANDPLNILDFKARSKPITADQRLVSSFQEINEFYKAKGRTPNANQSDISEFQLYQRLDALRENPSKSESLKQYDEFNLLEVKVKEINSINDILDDDELDLLGEDDLGLFNFEHVSKTKREKTDFVARREPCKDFDKYESKFIEVQKDLASGKRKLIDFKETLLKAGNYYVHNGVLLFLESIDYKTREWSRGENEQNRIRKFDDGRTKTIFENGTESKMYLRSLGKALINNGKTVTSNIDKSDEDFLKTFNNISDEDNDAGSIYVLKSLCMVEALSSIKDLYKIGYSKGDVTERIKNAKHDPTYLMADVQIVGIWECFNMNPQKFEQLLHNFFASVRLDLDVNDDKGKRHRPQEWFIVPIEVINQAIEMLADGSIVNYKYDDNSESIVLK